MTTAHNPQLDGFEDVVASVISNVFDTYGWPILATLLTVVFLGAILLFSYWTEWDLIDIEAMDGIYRFVRRLWRKTTVS
jgi:hypothetical protein